MFLKSRNSFAKWSAVDLLSGQNVDGLDFGQVRTRISELLPVSWTGRQANLALFSNATGLRWPTAELSLHLHLPVIDAVGPCLRRIF